MKIRLGDERGKGMNAMCQGFIAVFFPKQRAHSCGKMYGGTDAHVFFHVQH